MEEETGPLLLDQNHQEDAVQQYLGFQVAMPHTNLVFQATNEQTLLDALLAYLQVLVGERPPRRGAGVGTRTPESSLRTSFFRSPEPFLGRNGGAVRRVARRALRTLTRRSHGQGLFGGVWITEQEPGHGLSTVDLRLLLRSILPGDTLPCLGQTNPGDDRSRVSCFEARGPRLSLPPCTTLVPVAPTATDVGQFDPVAPTTTGPSPDGPVSFLHGDGAGGIGQAGVAATGCGHAEQRPRQ